MAEVQAPFINIRSADGFRLAWLSDEAPPVNVRDGQLGEHLDTGVKYIYYRNDWHKQIAVPAFPSFRADIGVAGVSGVAAEIIPGDAIVRVHGVFIAKPTALVTVRLIKNYTASTGGTSTNAVVVPLDSTKAPSKATVVKLFTAAPTAGTALGDLAEYVMDTTDWMYFRFGADGEQPVILNNPRETLHVNINATATITGFIAWTEEPQ